MVFSSNLIIVIRWIFFASQDRQWPGPVVHDNSEEDVGLRGRNPIINVMVENGVHGMTRPGLAAWLQLMASDMTPVIPPQFSDDPAYLAAHQRTLSITKHAYQMAISHMRCKWQAKTDGAARISRLGAVVL